MLGHRALNVEDYLGILKRRWWVICIPAVLLPIAAVAFSYTLTPQYVSQSTVLVDQQKISSDVVKPLDIGDLQTRLATTTARIESRSMLEPIINRYNLFASQHLPMDMRVALIKTKYLQILPIQSQLANGLPGFKVAFTAEDPHTAQQVCADIVGLYTQSDMMAHEAAATGTTDFLNAQIEEERHKLDDMDQKLATFKAHNLGALPDDAGTNTNILNSLGARLDSNNSQLQQLQQSRAMAQTMLAGAQQASTPAAVTARVQSADDIQLQKMQADLADLRSRYSDDYPDVKSMRRSITDMKAQIARENAAAGASTSSGPHVDSPEVAQLRTQIRGYDQQIAAKTKETADINAQMHSYEGRIQASPVVEQQYSGLTRDYETEKGIYTGLVSKRDQAQQQVEMGNRQQGETLTVLDSAGLPVEATFPKQSVFAIGGFFGGIFVGVLVVALLEYKDPVLRNERDVWAFTQLPTLAVLAWSADAAHNEPKTGFLQRIFSRKSSSEQPAA